VGALSSFFLFLIFGPLFAFITGTITLGSLWFIAFLGKFPWILTSEWNSWNVIRWGYGTIGLYLAVGYLGSKDAHMNADFWQQFWGGFVGIATSCAVVIASWPEGKGGRF
jgi:hypothetical protein